MHPSGFVLSRHLGSKHGYGPSWRGNGNQIRARAQHPAGSEHYRPVGWHADGDMVRAAYGLHTEDDDWGQAGAMVREVLAAARERLVSNVVGRLLNGVSEPVLQRAFQYWRNVDKNLDDKIGSGVRAKQG